MVLFKFKLNNKFEDFLIVINELISDFSLDLGSLISFTADVRALRFNFSTGN